MITLKSIMSTPQFYTHTGLPLALGYAGTQVLVADLAKMPHLLIAGATGSGKSVCLHNIILSLLFCRRDIDMLLIDPKRVEFDIYKDLGNVAHVYETEAAKTMLYISTLTMEYRYKQLQSSQSRHIDAHNAKVPDPLDYRVIIIDEFANLILDRGHGKEIERCVVRLAQMGRACGVHLVLATQRPTVNVVTGLIKANFPARISFPVATAIDSRVILDRKGAERLKHPGEMLFLNGYKLVRAKGAWASEGEIERMVAYLKGKTSLEKHGRNLEGD